MSRPFSFIFLSVLQLACVILFPFGPAMCTGLAYACERGKDRLRQEYIDPYLDLRQYYPAVSP